MTLISSNEVEKMYISWVAKSHEWYIHFSLHSMKCHIHSKNLNILYIFTFCHSTCEVYDPIHMQFIRLCGDLNKNIVRESQTPYSE